MMSAIPTRLAYGQTLQKMGSVYDDLVVLDADLSVSTQTALFAKDFPERFVNIGIAEANMMGVASGLALSGKKVFVSSFAMFAAGRAWEQIRNSISYMNLNVKIGATHSGLTVGPDGASHQALEDLAIMRSIPNMVVLSPADVYQTEKAVRAALKYNGPVYIRLSRNPMPIMTEPDTRFDIGVNRIKIDGLDGTIFASGITLKEAYEAVEELNKKGYFPRLVNVCSIKPMDRDNILKCAEETGFFLSVEDHQINGGIGSAIAEVLIEETPIPMKIMGVDNDFGASGSPKNLLDKYRISAKYIIEEYISKYEKVKAAK